ncbi:acyl-CoA dehydrogenase, partial [Streptomyces rubellomurinus subsp. indigoferus]
HHAMRLIGMAERAFELLCARVTARHASRAPIADHGVVQDCIPGARMRIEPARPLVLKTAWLMATGGNKGAHTEIQAIKVVTRALAERVLDKATQAHGGGG